MYIIVLDDHGFLVMMDIDYRAVQLGASTSRIIESGIDVELKLDRTRCLCISDTRRRRAALPGRASKRLWMVHPRWWVGWRFVMVVAPGAVRVRSTEYSLETGRLAAAFDSDRCAPLIWCGPGHLGLGGKDTRVAAQGD